MQYTISNFYYTQMLGWMATARYGDSLLSVSIPFDEVNAADAINFEDAYRTAKNLPADPKWGDVVDVEAEPVTVSQPQAAAYGDPNIAELEAEHRDWLDEQDTREAVRPQ